MSRVVDFPNLPRVGANTPPGREVVVAPLGEEVVAWVRVGNKALILERTPSWEHAVRDGRTYADRHNIPFRFQSVAFTTAQWDRPPQIQGEVYVTPSERDGGSWDVVHVSASGDTAATLGNAFSYDEADAMARRFAKEMGAAVHSSSDLPGGP